MIRENQHTTISESVLLYKIAEGNELAYTELVSKYWKKVLSHVLSFVKEYSIAEELTQDIFIKIWEKRKMLVDVKSFDNYLFIVSRNLIISHIRKKLRETDSLKDKKIQELYFKPDDQYEYKELASLINNGCLLLEEPRRSVFQLSRIEGRDTEYISEKLGIAPRTVRWHLLQALNFLRSYLNNHYKIQLALLLLSSLYFFL